MTDANPKCEMCGKPVDRLLSAEAIEFELQLCAECAPDGPRLETRLSHLEADAMESVATSMQAAAAPLLGCDPENRIGVDLEDWAARIGAAARIRRAVML